MRKLVQALGLLSFCWMLSSLHASIARADAAWAGSAAPARAHFIRSDLIRIQEHAPPSDALGHRFTGDTDALTPTVTRLPIVTVTISPVRLAPSPLPPAKLYRIFPTGLSPPPLFVI
jgi:hypothetical protein